MSYLKVTNQTAPPTPSTGKSSVYVDSTTKKLSTINDAGTVKTIEQVASQFYIPATQMYPQASNGCAAIATTSMATNKQDVQVLNFDKDAVEYAQSACFRMPSDWDAGTFTYSIDWKHASTTTNFKVAWAVDAICYADGEGLDAAWGTAVQVNDIGGDTSYRYATPTSAAVTASGTRAANNMMIVRVQRVATDVTNDTLAIDAGFIGIQINYTRT